MADRNTPAAATFEEWRVEFNELATDVGDINNLPSTINGQSVTDVIEAITQVNAGLSNVLFPNVIDFDDSPNANNERIKMGDSDDLQMYHDGSWSDYNEEYDAYDEEVIEVTEEQITEPMQLSIGGVL